MAQIYEIFGKRLRVEHDESGYCVGCALFGLGVCHHADVNCCLDSDGNDVEK